VECYRRRQTTVDDRSQRAQQYWPRTPCVASNNLLILKSAQEGRVVSMKDEYEVARALSDGDVADDLE